MKRSELQELIRETVREELKEHSKQMKRYVKAYIPMIIGEAVSAFIEDKLEEVPSPPKSKSMLSEVIDEFETLGNRTLTTKDRSTIANRSKLTALMGYGDVAGNNIEGNTVDQVITESGVAVPVDPTQIPDYLKNALNKDYRGVLDAMNKSSQSIRSQNRR